MTAIESIEDIVSRKEDINFGWTDVEDEDRENLAAFVTIEIREKEYYIELLCDSADRPPLGEYSAHVEGNPIEGSYEGLLRAKSEVERMILAKYPSARTAKQSPMSRLR